MIDLICQAQRWFCHDPDEIDLISVTFSGSVIMWEGREPDEVIR